MVTAEGMFQQVLTKTRFEGKGAGEQRSGPSLTKRGLSFRKESNRGATSVKPKDTIFGTALLPGGLSPVSPVKHLGIKEEIECKQL